MVRYWKPIWVGHLKGIGDKIDRMLQQNVKIQEMRSFLDKVYNSSGHKEDIKSLTDSEVLELASNLKNGFHLQLTFLMERLKMK